ncbi:MAG: ABC transporter permease [Rhodocyclaceae bacterium]|nr:ABC transporter permease [Rhodocyclaceae bacterium]
MKTVRLALRMLARDLRAGELTVLFLALVLAVAALTGVAFLADRVERAVRLEAHQLLGGDLLLTADHPWHERFRVAARARGLRLAESASFPSMVASDSGVHLAEIKAVSPEYPLRGQLRAAPRLNAPDAPAGGPAPGTAWPDARLAAALAVEPPATLKVGARETAVTAILTLEPDRGVNPFSIAPRLLMPLSDLAATGLIQPGSRITWRLHLAGEAQAIADYRRWAESELGRGERIEGLEDARPEIRALIERANRFLSLAALLTVVLAAVAVGLAARRYMQTHLDACAVMRCFGASERQLMLIHGGEFVFLGWAAIIVGGLAGYLLQFLLQHLLAGLVASELPPAGARAWLQGAAVGTVLVAGFVLPPLLRLKSAPTLRVLRREWAAEVPLTVGSYLAGLCCLAALMFWIAGHVRLGAAVLGGFCLALGLFALGARLLLGLIGWAAGRWVKDSARLGLANLRRRALAATGQIVALAVGLTALLVLTLARTDLLAAWQARVPPDAPNRFIINIQPEQREALAAFFAAAGLAPPRLEPMVRARLVRINDRPVSAKDYAEERAQHLVEREFNLSMRAELPPGNEIVAGQWHAPGEGLSFSVEQGLAEKLRLQLGDQLTFEIAGQPIHGTITSLRKLDWDSMRVNFFVIAPEGALAGQPTSYITSFHLPPSEAAFLDRLVRAFPNLTIIDVAALLRQLQETLDQVSHAVELVFAFALIAGVVVLYAALQASAAERRHELAVLRALGGQRAQLRRVLTAEFAVLGAVAGLLAGGMAMALGTALARWVFQLDYWPTPAMVLTGLAIGAVGVAATGLFAIRQALSAPVVRGLCAE